VLDRQTHGQTDGQTDNGAKNNMSPLFMGGDIIRQKKYNVKFKVISFHTVGVTLWTKKTNMKNIKSSFSEVMKKRVMFLSTALLPSEIYQLTKLLADTCCSFTGMSLAKFKLELELRGSEHYTPEG